MIYLLALVLCLALTGILWVQKNRTGLCVLMYHHVGPVTDPNEKRFFIDAGVFESQMNLLASKGFHPVSLSDVESAHEQRQKLPRRSVMITLDDGWADNYMYAFPIALKKKVPITIFLSSELVGGKDMLTWEQISEMRDSGLVQFASHGARHKRLRSLSDQEALDELTQSRTTLTQKLGIDIKSFCYPYGAADKRIRRLVFKAGYMMDYGTRKGINAWPWRANRPLLRAHVMAGESLESYHTQLDTGYKKILLFSRR